MERRVQDDTRRLLDTLQQLIELPGTDLESTLSRASDLVADATGADKVDAFLYDATRDSLVASASNQPLSAVQKAHGLDVLQLANGGRAVQVFQSGEPFHSGHVESDAEELRGVRETLKVRSHIGVPLSAGGRRIGMMLVASQQPEFFTEEDVRFAATVAHWIGVLAHRADLVGEISRQAAEQGRRAAAEELITVLAHDLNNYLGPIELRLYALQLRAEREGRKDDLSDISVTQQSLRRLASLVSDILDVTRLDEGLFQAGSDRVDLAQLAREVATMLGTASHPVSVLVQSAVELTVSGNPGRLRQCLENLLSNAIQNSPRDAEVQVFVRSAFRDSRTFGLLEVVDQGTGITDEIQSRLYERFVTGRAREGGLGLGLYLARRIALAHGGDITAESRAGEGARFLLSLPCA